jgi:hypothetical protein
MRVTSARLEDALALAQIHVASWQAAYVGLFPAEYLASLSVAERQERWQTILVGSTTRTLVAWHEGQVVGFVSFGRCRDAGSPACRGEVWALYASPAAWSTGAGCALWEAARVQMLHAGFTEVSLWVLSGNARGLRFVRASVSATRGLRRRHERASPRPGSSLASNPSIERTFQRPLRALWPAAHGQHN